MKQLIIIFIAFLSITSSYSQKKVDITGKWRTVSVDNGYVYINSKIDSVSLSDEAKHMYKTAEAQQKTVESVRLGLSKNHFIFDKNGSYRHLDTENENIASIFGGTYSVEKNNITAYVENKRGIKSTKKMKFELKEGLLHLTTEERGDGKSTTYILEKIR